MGSFVGTLQALVYKIAPWFLQGPKLGAFCEAIGLVLDGSVDTLVAGLRLAQPLLCDVSALPHIAADRDILLYDTEPTFSQRYRLSKYLQLHRYRSTHFGEMSNIQPFFLGTDGLGLIPTIKVVHQSGGGSPVATWHTLSPYDASGEYLGVSPFPPGSSGTYTVTTASPSNWNYDGQTSKWSRWWCIIHLPPGYAHEITYDSGAVYDAGAVYDGISALAVADIVAGLKEAKGGHSRLAGVIVTSLQPTDSIPGFPGAHPFDPTSSSTTNADGSTNLPVGNWGSVIGPDNKPTRPSWASWIYEDNP